MKRIAGLVLCFMLTGCLTTAPVIKAPKFPESPGSQVMESCPALKELDSTTELSEIATVVTENYSTYYQCSVKVDAWIEWYKLQKDIYENATK
jgi:hypothetical protein